jgi:fimbrial isopeptide formation D2 family protein
MVHKKFRAAALTAVAIALLIAGVPLAGLPGLARPEATYAAQLDPAGVTAPAARSHLTASPSGTKGADGFVLNNGNGEDGYSSWDNADHALNVPEKYASYYLTSWTDANGAEHVAAYDHFGTAAQSRFVTETADYYDTLNLDAQDIADEYWCYDVTSAANGAGDFGVWIYDLGYVDASTGEITAVDLKITCSDFTTDTFNGMAWVAIQKESMKPDYNILGLREAQFNYIYYLAGTKTPISLATNMTLTDIDGLQYVALKAGSGLAGVFLDPHTTLYYGYSGGYHILYDGGHTTVLGLNAPESAVGFVFMSGQSGYTYVVGSMKTMQDGTHHAHFDSTRRAMYVPPVPDPVKTVSDSDESGATGNTLINPNETFEYRVSQIVPEGMYGDIYFKSFKMTDQIDSCLGIESVALYNSRDGSGGSRKAYWTASGGLIQSDWGTIAVSAGNLVTYTASGTVLASEDFYGGSSMLGTEKTLVIRCAWKKGITAATIAAHGHMASGGGLQVKNSGTVTIDDDPATTNEVTTTVYAPDKTVTDSDESAVTGNTLNNVLETYHYDVSQRVPVPGGSGKYTAFLMKDTIESCLEVTGVRVYMDGATDVTTRFRSAGTGNAVVMAATAEALADASFYGHTYTLRIDVKLRTDVSEATLRAHGHYTDGDSTLEFVNTGRVAIGDGPDIETGEVTTRVPVPDLLIEKSVDVYENQVGDTYRYTIKVSHSANSAGDAADVRIWDCDLPAGVSVSGIAVTGVQSAGKSITATPGGFEFYCDVLRKGETAVIAFDAQADRTLNGTVIENVAHVTSFADTGGDPSHPKSDGAEVYINSPKLLVEKTVQSDTREIVNGSEIHYRYTITNTNPGTFMRDVVTYDSITQAGVRLLPGTIAVQDSAGRLITGRCDITVSGNSFTVEPAEPYDIGYFDGIVPPKTLGRDPSFPPVLVTYGALLIETSMTVSYSVNVTNADLIGESVTNLATAPTRDNTNGDPIKQDDEIPSGGDDDTVEVRLDGDTPDIASPPAIPETVDTPPAITDTVSPSSVIMKATSAAIIQQSTEPAVTVAAVDDSGEDGDDKPAAEDEPEEDDATESSSPDTGDGFPLFPLMMLMVITGAGIGLIVLRLQGRRVM